MDSSAYLSADAVQNLANEQNRIPCLTLQLMKIETDLLDGAERKFAHLSDGSHFSKDFLLTTQASKYALENQLKEFAIVAISDTTLVVLNNRPTLLVKKLKLVDASVGHIIGSPILLPLKKKSKETMVESSPRSVTDIRNLSILSRNATVCGRVTYKGQVKAWTNKTRSGKVVSIHILDASGEIVMTAFDDSAEKLYSGVTEGKAYQFKNVDAKPDTMKTFVTKFKLLFTSSSEIEHSAELEAEMPQAKFSFTAIGNLAHLNAGEFVDILGVCTDQGPVCSVFKKGETQFDLRKRDITLLDASRKKIVVTLWGATAEAFAASSCATIAVKMAKVSTFGGKSLSTTFASKVLINPKTPEATKLAQWFFNEPSGSLYESLTLMLPLEGCETVSLLCDIDEDLSVQAVGSCTYVQCIVKIVSIDSDNALYLSCPNEKCRRKVLKQEDAYKCNNCDAMVNSPKPQLTIQLAVEDNTDIKFVRVFNTLAEQLVHKSASDLYDMQVSDSAAFKNAFACCLYCTYKMVIRIRIVEFNGQKQQQLDAYRFEKLEQAIPEAGETVAAKKIKMTE